MSAQSTSRPVIFKRTMSGKPLAIIDNLAKPAGYEKGLRQVAQGISSLTATDNVPQLTFLPSQRYLYHPSERFGY